MAKTLIKEEGSPSGAWMATFSDMNTLLLTFFVLLYSMGSMSSDNFTEIFGKNKGDYMGFEQARDQETLNDKIYNTDDLVRKDSMAHALNAFQNEGATENATIGLMDGVEFDMPSRADGEISILLADRLLFSPGQIELSEESKELLTKLQTFIRSVVSVTPRRIYIEGHTDNSTPLQERYIISARRAEKVRAFLLTDKYLPPELFSIIGYGASRPLVPNDSDANRARNRRVRIYLEPPDRRIESQLF